MKLFPLPLTAFEEYMVEDDRASYPMNFFIGLRLVGQLQPDALVTAVEYARGRHPLLDACLRRSGKEWVWTPAGADHLQVRWTGQTPGDGFPPASPIDLIREPGLRVHASVGDGCTNLDLQFHHAACDGLGAFRFVNDLLVAYAAAVEGDVTLAKLHRLDAELLAGRGKFGLTFARFLRILPKQLVGLLGVRQFLMRKPVSLAAPANPPRTTPSGYPGVLTESLDEEVASELWAQAADLGVTANDLLLADLFKTIQIWGEQRGRVAPDDWLRLAVPMNLRTAADRRLPAANVTTMVFLDRQPRDLADPQDLLTSIQEEMQLIKRLRLGLTFNFSLAVARRLPGGLRKGTKKDRGMSTCVLTNLGAPLAKTPLPRVAGKLQIGGLTLERMELAAPIRPHTAAAFSVWKEAGELHLSLHYDTARLSRRDADSLLAEFIRQVQCSAMQTRPMALAF